MANNMTSNDRYYTPSENEFVQGFEFEKLVYKKGDKLGAAITLDGSSRKDIYADKDKWVCIKVWWDREPETVELKYGDVTITAKEFPRYDWYPWIEPGYIQKLIDDGRIRARK